MKRVLTGLILPAMLLSVLVGCSGDNKPADTNTPSPSPSVSSSLEDDMKKAGNDMKSDMENMGDDMKDGFDRMVENGKVD